MIDLEKYLRKLTLYVLVPLLLIGLLVFIIDGNKTDIYGNSVKESNEIEEEGENLVLDSSFMSKRIGKDVYKIAEKYTKMNIVYRDAGRGEDENQILIDCSGLVINCYNKALEGTKYALPFTDVSSTSLYETYVDKIDTPNKGDLIFMSYREDKAVNHVGIVEEIKKDKVYFIDATPNDNNESKKAVNKRSYDISDEKIIGYGVMKLKKIK